MDQFSSIIGTVLNGLGVGKGAKPGTGLSGSLALMQAISQMSLASKEKQAVDRSLWYSKHPEAIASMETQFEKPLNQGLIKGTENIVNASLGEQGLSQAPGIQQQVSQQALAPYIQQNQQTALMEVFKALGLPAEALQALAGMKSPGALAMQLKSILPQGPGAAGAPGSTTPFPTPSLPQDPNSFPGLAPPWNTDPSAPAGGS